MDLVSRPMPIATRLILPGGFLGWLVCGLLITACSASSVGPTPMSSLNPKQPLIDEFERNLAKWQQTGIERYAFTYAPFCYCQHKPHLVVGDEDQVRVDGLPVGTSSDASTHVPAGVPGLFALVRRAIDGDAATITYDPTTGVPTGMDSDPVSNAIDDELSFEVTGWTLEPPDDDLLGKLSTALARWNGLQIWSYHWSIRIACDCNYDGRKFDIIVHDNDPFAWSDGKRVSTGKLEGVPTTISRFFEVAAAWVVKLGSSATFDPDLGYPTRVSVGPDPTVPGQSETIEVVSFTRP